MILIIGLAGAGKSVFAKRYFSHLRVVDEYVDGHSLDDHPSGFDVVICQDKRILPELLLKQVFIEIRIRKVRVLWRDYLGARFMKGAFSDVVMWTKLTPLSDFFPDKKKGE